MCTSRRLRVTPEQDGCCHEQDNDQLLVFKIMMLVMHNQGNMNELTLQDCADHDHDKRWIFEFNDDIDVVQHKGLVADDGDDAWKLTMVMTIDDGDDD